MLDNQKIARFIAERRKAIGITQAEAAQTFRAEES